MPPRPIIQRNDQYVTHRIGAKLPSTWSANCGNISACTSRCRSLMPSTQPSRVCVDRNDEQVRHADREQLARAVGGAEGEDRERGVRAARGVEQSPRRPPSSSAASRPSRGRAGRPRARRRRTRRSCPTGRTAATSASSRGSARATRCQAETEMIDAGRRS